MKLDQVLAQYLDAYIKSSEDLIAVACSGGIDSLVLLDALKGLYPANLIYCLHLDHGLRKDSPLAIDFLDEYCKKNSIKFIYKQYKFGELKADEDTARKKRYGFFEEVCLQNGIKNLFLAHNLNDQAETVLFRLFRGTNSAGLQGIAPKRMLNGQITIHRPLLELSRLVIEEYAKLQKLEYIEDSSNQDLKYARNRIRSEILPHALEINSKALENIQLSSQIIKEEQDYLNSIIEKHLIELGDLPWDLNQFRTLDRILQRKILERTFTTNISFVNDFLEAIKQGGFHKINFAKDKFFVIKQKQIYLFAL